MTVIEIKEKINNAIQNTKVERQTTVVRYLLSVLYRIEDMLDELDDVEQIKRERDIAEKQLHKLGYELGEEVTTCTRCKFGSIVTDGAGIEHQDCDIGKKALSPICRNKCDYFELHENRE